MSTCLSWDVMKMASDFRSEVLIVLVLALICVGAGTLTDSLIFLVFVCTVRVTSLVLVEK